MHIDELLTNAINMRASDLHLSVNMPPVVRVDGKLIRMEAPLLTRSNVEELLLPILSGEQRRQLEQTWELDMSYTVRDVGRFRLNIYKQCGTYAAAFRSINTTPPTFEELGLTEIVRKICERPRGLILVTGPTGSGKTTTLAAMIDYINSTRAEHILTVEDPIEFIHTSKKGVVHQRELGQDTRSFANALKSALREDPDIILLGEMRDLETISLALTAAETGHLVLGTLHTSNAASTVDRIVDVFPEGQQTQIRIQLASSLVAVLSQTLLPKVLEDGVTKKGRVMAQEILINNTAIANLIREGKTAQIYSILQTSMGSGMQTLEAALKTLFKQKMATFEDALSKTSRQEEFMRLTGMTVR